MARSSWPPPRAPLRSAQAYAPTVGAILEMICDSLMDATAKQLDEPSSSVATAESSKGGGGGKDRALEGPSSGDGDGEAASSGDGGGGGGGGAAGPSSAHDVQLLPIDRALLSSLELRQTCGAMELLRAAAREGAPAHEWSIPNFSSLGSAKLSSPAFELYGRRWTLLFHPRGCGANAQGTHLSAYLRLESGVACDARVRLAVRNHATPAISAFNKPWQWRFESNGKNRGMSSLLPLTSANDEAGFVEGDTLTLQLWLRPLGAAEARCLPPGQEGGLPHNDVLQPAARRYFHSKLLVSVWTSPADDVKALIDQLAPAAASSSSSSSSGGGAVNDAEWAAERQRLQLLALSAAAADGRADSVACLLDSGAMHITQLRLHGLPEAFQQYSGPCATARTKVALRLGARRHSWPPRAPRTASDCI